MTKNILDKKVSIDGIFITGIATKNSKTNICDQLDQQLV